MTSHSDNAGVVAHPPLLYLGALAAGCVATLIWPLWAGFANPPAWAQYAGGALIVAGGALLAWAIACFTRAGTNVPTHMPSTTIVTSGPYGFSRNPIYIALTAIYCGLAMVLTTVWALLFLPVVLVILSRGVIAREEAYLAAKFPDAYEAYRARVRRWL